MADVSGKFFSAKKVRTGVSPSSPGVIVGETLPPVNPPGGGLNSVGLTMPAAFDVANSPLTSNGTIEVTGAGTTAEYVRGDGSLATFPALTGFVPYTGATADVDLGTHDLTAERGTFENNGSSDTLTVNHTSGSGYGIEVTKGGNNEALYVNKTSGSGNAMAVVGGRTALVDLSLSSVSNATGNFLTISGGVVHQRTPSETRSDVGAQAQLNGTGFVKASGTTITYDNSTYQVTSEKAQPNGYASLDSNGKVPLVQINDALIGNVNFQGLWNAASNTPTLANPPASGTKGYYYIVSTAGTFAGISFEVGDWIISNGTAWGKVDNTDAVSSVFGRTGNVTATNGDYNTSQVTELTNLYYTEARVNANANVAANTAARHNAVTLGTANGLSLSTQVLSLALASGSTTGALSSTDWTTFNNKENAITAGTTAQYFRGDKTFQTLNTGAVPESGNLYFTNARAIASVLTGYSSGAGTISAADTILSAIQKLNGNIGALVTGVSSVNGQTGVVVLTTTNIAEGTNLYYTESRVNANTNVAANTAARHAAVTLGTANGLSLNVQQLSLGLASAGVTGALSGTDWTTFNSKENAITAGTTAQYYRGDKTFQTLNTAAVPELTNLYYTEARVSANTDVAANTAARHNAVTLGTANGLSLSTQQLSLGLASSSANGALSSTDWTTFNNKQNALTNPVTGTGTAGQVAFWNGTNTQSGNNGLVWDNVNRRLSILPDDGNNGLIIGHIFRTQGKYLFRTGGVNAETLNILSSNDNGSTFNGSVGININSITFSTQNTLRWSILSTGILQSNGAQTIQTLTGNLTLATAAGNGNILLTPNGTGKIGIGITNPSVFALVDANGQFRVSNNSVQGFYQARTSDTAGAGVFGGNSFVLRNGATSEDLCFDVFNRSTSVWYTPLIIKNTGNVGIGTASPSTILDVSSVTPTLTLRDSRTGGTWSAGIELGKLDFFTSDTTGIGAHSIASIGVIAGGANTASPDGVMVFSTGLYNTAPTEKMRITSAGNVGIGTASPANLIHGYVSSGSIVTVLKLENASATASSGTAISFTEGGTERAKIVSQIGTGTTPYLSFENNGAERVRITSTGNVGIGTAASFSASKLLVAGAAATGGIVSQDTTSTGSFVRILGDVTAGNLINFQAGTSLRFSSSNADFSSNAERMRITAAGRVLIGTPPPTESTFQLDVNGTARVSGAATFSSSVTAGGLIQSNITKAGTGIENVNFLQLRLFGTNAIGDSLDIRYLNSAGNNIANISAILGGDNVAYGSLAFSTRNFFTDSMVEVMRINNRGNVLIGTTSDNTARLQVSGDARVSGVVRSDAATGLALGSVSGYRRLQYDLANTRFSVLTDSNTSANFEALNGLFISGTNQNTIGSGSLSLINFSAYNSSANQSITLGLALDTAVNNNAAYNYLFNVGGNADGQNLTLSSRRRGIADLTILTVNGNNGASTFASTLTANGITSTASLATPHTTKSANYTLDATDYTVGFDCASNRTATLPDATTCAGRVYVIYQYNTGGGTRSVTLDGNGSQTINGVTTYSLAPYCDFTSVVIQSNGSNWIIISSNLTADCL
jgi:hypothetical protein